MKLTPSFMFLYVLVCCVLCLKCLYVNITRILITIHIQSIYSLFTFFFWNWLVFVFLFTVLLQCCSTFFSFYYCWFHSFFLFSIYLSHSYFFSLNCPINQSVSISIETSISCCSTSLIIEAADTFRKSSISMSFLIMHQILDCQVLCISTSKRVLRMLFTGPNRCNT